MNQEIKLHDGELIAGMCPVVGRPNAFLMITTWGHMWFVTLHSGVEGRRSVDRWEASRLPSLADTLNTDTGREGL